MAVDLAVFDGKALRIYDGTNEVGKLFANSGGVCLGNLLSATSDDTPIKITSSFDSANNLWNSEILLKGGQSATGGIEYLNTISLSQTIDIKSDFSSGALAEIIIDGSTTTKSIDLVYKDSSGAIKGELYIDDSGITFEGGQTFNGDTTVNGSLTVAGDLNISGQINQVNVTQLHVEDTMVILNSNLDSGDPQDVLSGMLAKRGDPWDGTAGGSGYKYPAIVWREVEYDTTNHVYQGWWFVRMMDLSNDVAYEKEILALDSLHVSDPLTLATSIQSYSEEQIKRNEITFGLNIDSNSPLKTSNGALSFGYSDPFTVDTNNQVLQLMKVAPLYVDANGYLALDYDYPLAISGTKLILAFNPPLTLSGNNLDIALDSQSLEVNGSNQLQVKLDPAGAVVRGTNGLAVNVDNTTINITGNTIHFINPFIKEIGRYYFIFQQDTAADSLVTMPDFVNGDPRYENSILFLGKQVLIHDDHSSDPVVTYDYDVHYDVNNKADGYVFHFSIPANEVLYIVYWLPENE